MTDKKSVSDISSMLVFKSSDPMYFECWDQSKVLMGLIKIQKTKEGFYCQGDLAHNSQFIPIWEKKVASGQTLGTFLQDTFDVAEISQINK